VGSSLAVLAAALLLGGALGKSAQLPLQTWLPDAMAGPTPVSALIHAATMVTAGVYLIARTHALFTLAPVIQAAVAVIGAMTLLIAGCSALVQSDIKRVLAYSTMSQIGYMFLALGVGAWSAAMFHFFTHAFFKSLLFLAAGAVILSTHHQQDMFKLGGMRTQLPLTFWTFLAGACSLAALPLITDGFYSKDLIIWYAWSSPKGDPWLWSAAVVGTLITAVYSFRMVFLTFFGPARVKVSRVPGNVVRVPLVILAVLSLVAGFVEVPHSLGKVQLFSDFLNTALPPAKVGTVGAGKELFIQMLCSTLTIAGICVAYVLFAARPAYAKRLAETHLGSAVHRLWYSGWKFDNVYEALFIRPFLFTAQRVRTDLIDLLYTDLAQTAEVVHYLLSSTQTGRVRHYALGIALAAVITLGIVVLS
jgi:NADH-quinone oxidoreductase subunit L